jgi:flagellar biosynthesis protein FliQ
MLTDDEKPKLDYWHIDDKKNQAPNWLVVEDLLGFADKLKTKCDDVSDRIFLLNSLQIFSCLILSLAITFFTAFLSVNYFEISAAFIWIILAVLVLTFFGFWIFIDMSLIKLRRRVRSDQRALDSVVSLLRDNYNQITEDFSELQKIQLKIRLSRFNIQTSTNEFHVSSKQ